MKHNQLTQKDSVISYSLPKDVIFKIFACADLATKKIMRRTCSTLSILAITDILKHSPLIISRKDHLYHMINTAQRNDPETFMNLLCNADNCDHTDICNTMSYFLPQDSTELKLIETDSEYHGPVTAEQLLQKIMAVYAGDEATLNQYIAKHVKPENRNADIQLHIAVNKMHPIPIAELFLLHNPSLLNFKCQNNTPLFLAVLANNLEICKFLLSFKEIEPEIPNSDGLTPLIMAANGGHTEIATLLIDHIRDHNPKKILPTTVDRMPWYYAAKGGHMDILKSLLIPTNFEVEIKEKPLHIATQYNQLEIVKMLLKHPNTDINAQDEFNFAPLHCAAANNSLPIAECLLEKNANINITDSNNQTPLWTASNKGHTEMVTLLLSNNADPNIISKIDNATALMMATENNYYNICELLLKNGAEVDAIDSYEYTSLLTAADKGYCDIVQLLLTYGAHINHQVNNKTALWLASSNGHTEAVTLLLTHKANTIIGSKDSYTPLHIAIWNGHIPVIQTLIEHGANPNIKIKDNVTPLMFATEKNNYEVCEFLLKNGAEVDAADSYGWTSLLTATDEGHLDIVQLLLTYGANIHHQTNDHRTALSLALSNEHELIINLLLEQPNIKINEKENELLTAFRRSQEEKS